MDERLGVVASGRFSRPAIRVAHGRGASAVKFARGFPRLNVSSVVANPCPLGIGELSEARAASFAAPEFQGVWLDAKRRRCGIVIECCGHNLTPCVIALTLWEFQPKLGEIEIMARRLKTKQYVHLR